MYVIKDTMLLFIRYILCSVICQCTTAFIYNCNTARNFLHMRQETPNTLWSTLSSTFKNNARDWFIQRAERKNISWNSITNKYKTPNNKQILMELYNVIEDKDIEYPSYYTQPFHGYDTGNLNWLAAQEGEAATLSMSVNYWDNVSPYIAEQWVRLNVSSHINNYIKTQQLDYPYHILDMGCSIGVSTEYLYNSFRRTKNIQGLDLSPYFLSVASFRKHERNLSINYIHGNAENTKLPARSYNMIVCNFMLHEVPNNATKNILNEIYRILKPGGVIVIVDLDPIRVQNNLIVSQFRKWAFEVTEPHIYEYYKHDMNVRLLDANFKYIVTNKNDPINRVWIGTKQNNEYTMHKHYAFTTHTYPSYQIQPMGNISVNGINSYIQ